MRIIGFSISSFIKIKKLSAKTDVDTDNFLCLLRRLYPLPSANSLAKPASSNTLTEAGYARSHDEN